MKNKTYFILAVLILMITFFQNCSGSFKGIDSLNTTSSSSTNPLNNNVIQNSSLTSAESNLQKNLSIGFYGIIGWGSDYYDQVKDFTNVAWISAEVGDPLVAIKTVETLKKLSNSIDKKAMIDVQQVFFDDKLKLRSDSQLRWNKYLARILPYKNHILSFYPMDEPYGWGYGAGISYETMQLQMEKVAEIIKSSALANIPLSISFTINTVNLPIPSGYDWIGVDCYGSWDNCEGKSIPEHYNILKSKLLPHQKLILFADAALRSQQMTSTTEQQINLLDRLKKYFEYAQTESLVVGIFPFIWQSIPSQHTIGAADIPAIKSGISDLTKKYIKIANTKTPSIPTNDKTPVTDSPSTTNPNNDNIQSPVSGTKICPAGYADISSPDNSNICRFTWGDTSPYINISTSNGKMTASNGGSANAVCDKQLKWDHTYSCPNKSSSITCPGGSITKYSIDGVNSCVFRFPQTNAGSTLKNTSSSSELKGGNISGTCNNNGVWTYSWTCPGIVKSCAGGAIYYPSSSGKAQCYFSWQETRAGQSAMNMQDSSGNGGTASGWICKDDGTFTVGKASCP